MQVSPHFTRQEFDCNDGTPVPPQYMKNCIAVANHLEVIRADMNADTSLKAKYPGVEFGIVISGSGYRTPEHNKRVGGAPQSQHLTCSGADISSKYQTPQQLAARIEKLIKAKKLIQGGLGIYPGFVHTDIRGTKARW